MAGDQKEILLGSAVRKFGNSHRKALKQGNLAELPVPGWTDNIVAERIVPVTNDLLNVILPQR